MRRNRAILLLPLLVLVGCDVAAAAFLFGKKDGGDDSGIAASSGGASEVFKVWVASIPSESAADSELAALNAANGNPSTPTWTEVGNATLTTEFGPLASPSSFNSILIQASSGQNYLLDCVEILGTSDQVQEYASGRTWSNRVDFPDRMLGAPDGSAAITNAVGEVRSFIFTRYAGPIYKFRINGQGQGQPPASGDTTGTGTVNSPGTETPGGATTTSGTGGTIGGGLVGGVVDGLIDVPLNVGGTLLLARFDTSGEQVGGVQIASGVSAGEGSQAAAVDANGKTYVASTVGNGQVLVRQFARDLSPGWSVTFSSGLGGDRVEENGIAVDADGDIVVGGGRNGLLTGVSHWLARLSGSGTVVWEQNPDDDVSGPTYWRGVSTGTGGQIFSAGDLNPSLLGGTNLVRTAKFSSGGTSQWSEQYGDTGSSSNLGRAVEVDSSGTIIVGGFLGTSNEGRNGVLLRYSPGGAVISVSVHDGPAGGDDEILDVAVDSDGSLYAVGYETAPGQGENWWVRKYASNGAPAWTRTFDGGNGNDRAVSVALAGSRVMVVGTRTNSAGQRKFLLRVYAK